MNYVMRDNVVDANDMAAPKVILNIKTLHVGTYSFNPSENVVFTAKGIRIVAPHTTRPDEKIAINIQKSEIIKIIYNFSGTAVMFLYVLNSCGKYIRDSLGMDIASKNEYFSPFSSREAEKRIIFEIRKADDKAEATLQTIYVQNMLDKISEEDAKAMLRRIITKPSSYGNRANKPLLVYPPTGADRVTINIEDFECLATDEYLNDIIISFYLKYVLNELLTKEQRQKTHVFSTFFYNRLTKYDCNTPNKSISLSPAQKRHDRVKNWTKNVNLFEKDFIIIPINEQQHWYLAIICFPWLSGPVTMDGGVAVKHAVSTKRTKNFTEGTSVASESKRKENIILLDEEEERDEADGDESELDDYDIESDSSDTEVSAQPIKQPCILFFDSLVGANRCRVLATLRDYLTQEYKSKVRKDSNHVFNRFNMPGCNVKVPQQTNFTDCGLYLLQYVEQFFKDPIRDYSLPLKHLSKWFEPITVTKKREDIVLLLRQLITKYNSDAPPLPEIRLPTLDGKILEPPDFSEEHSDFEEAGDDQLNLEEENHNYQPAENESGEPPSKKKRMVMRKLENGTLQYYFE